MYGLNFMALASTTSVGSTLSCKTIYITIHMYNLANKIKETSIEKKIKQKTYVWNLQQQFPLQHDV
jgi:hypothetical protein